MIKTIIKTIMLVAILFVANNIDTAISPIIANELALQQMNNSVDSSMWIQMYMSFSSYKYLLAGVTIITTYASEIEALVLYMLRDRNNE